MNCVQWHCEIVVDHSRQEQLLPMEVNQEWSQLEAIETVRL